jgi:hypothetical protein
MSFRVRAADVHGKTWSALFTCNRVKGGCLPEEAGMQLIHKPQWPEWTPFMLRRSVLKRYQEWLPYLNAVDVALEHGIARTVTPEKMAKTQEAPQPTVSLCGRCMGRIT